MYAERVGSCQSHNRDRDRCAVHVDGRAKRNRYRVHILVKAELLAQFHIDGDIGRAASCEESCNAALAKASEYQGIRIPSQEQEGDEGIDHKRDEHHAADKDDQKVSVIFKDRETVFGNRAVYESADSERGKVDDPSDSCGNRFCCVAQDSSCLRRSDLLKGQAQHCCPEQDSDIVAVHDCGDRVLYHLEKKVLKNFTHVLRHRIGLRGLAQSHCDREHKARDNGRCRRQKRTEHIEEQYKTEFTVQFALSVTKGADDQHKYKNRCHCAECADKHASKDSDPGPAGHGSPEDRACHKADHDPDDQAGFRIFFDNAF